MLFYESIRESSYLFSVINHLNRLNQDENTKSKIDKDKNGTSISQNRTSRMQRLNRLIYNGNQVQNNLRNRRPITESSPILSRRREGVRNGQIQPQIEKGEAKQPYSYDILLKS